VVGAILRDIIASMERSEAEAARVAAKSRAYNGEWRRKTDVIDIDARVIEEMPLLPAPTNGDAP
jgi:hypothetical protein